MNENEASIPDQHRGRVFAFFATRFRKCAGILTTLLCGLLIVFASAPGEAVLLSIGDGRGNTEIPAALDLVGTLNGASGTYLGSGWVLTANHVGTGDFVLRGVTYQTIPGTAHRLSTSSGEYADLRMFKVYPTPPVASRPIRTLSPILGEPVLMIGNGRDRGQETSFDPFGPDIDPPTQTGWRWESTQHVRWGLNEVDYIPSYRILGTEVFMTQFDELDPIIYESQATSGDSGGAVIGFDPVDGSQLMGIMISVTLEFGQNAWSSLFTNDTIIASLDGYVDEINETIALPEPSGAFASGLALLMMLARRRPTPDARASHESLGAGS